MTFKQAIEKLMPAVQSGSNEPLIIYREPDGGWHCDYTQNQYGEEYDWIERVQDPFAVTVTGHDMANGSFPSVYDRIYAGRLRAEYENAGSIDACPDELKALMALLEENIGEFSCETTDYLIMQDRPLAALYEMTPISLVVNRSDYDYDFGKLGEFVDAVEAEISSRLQNRKKHGLAEGTGGAQNQPETPGERVIEGFEEKHCVEIAGKYIVLAENPAAAEPYLVCNIQYSNMFGVAMIEERHDAAVTDNYLEAMREFVNRVDGFLKTLETEQRSTGLPFQALTAAGHCLPGSQSADFNGKLIIVKASALKPECRTATSQYMRCSHGNGARPGSLGTSVFGTELFSGKSVCYQRYQIEGVADLEKLPEWAKSKMAAETAKNKSNEMSEPAYSGRHPQ